MRTNIDRFLTDLETKYKREIEMQPRKHVGFFSLITFAVFILFGVVGFRPSVIALAQKNKFKEELKDLVVAMETKITQLENAEEDLIVLGDRTNALNKAIPTEPQTDIYLQEFVKVAARNGFVVKRFTPVETQPQATELSVETVGEIFRLTAFTKDIENMERLTKIKDVQVTTGTARSKVNMTIVIYFVKELPTQI